MDDSFARGEACRPRRVSADADLGANVSSRRDEVVGVTPVRKPAPAAGRLSSAAGRMERRKSAPQVVHQRHMPMEPNKFHIPRKTKEKKALFQFVSTESREYEDMKTILTSSYIDTSSAGCFAYSNPRLVHSELLEKEFVEKRKEMKADGRTDKEMEESYCFLLTTSNQLPVLCEKGLTVGPNRITLLGDPLKGVYLSKYSDLLRTNPFTPGATGEIIIFKVMKGKVKSIYDNMKMVQDPTPHFDSHVAKNASKVTSLTCYSAFEFTQQYFYEYVFAELRPRPRQVCPYAVVSFQIKGKDAPLPSKPAAPIRLNSQPSEGRNERPQFTVWSGDLVKNNRVLFQISLRSNSIPFLPHRLPEKLDVGYLIKLNHVTKLIPSGLLSYDLYNGSKEVVADGHYCSLLEVIGRNRSTVNVTTLLQELETKRVVLVSPLPERGFLFLLSSVQMATVSERGDARTRCLHALFVFPEPRDMSRFTSRFAFPPRESLKSNALVMPRLKEFLPALHQALIKARANPPSNLSAGVELQTKEYFSGLKDGSVPPYPMAEYDSILDDEGKLCPPKHHRASMDSYLQTYLSNPTLYLLPVPRVKQVVQAHCGPEQLQETTPRISGGGQAEAAGDSRDGQSSNQKMQQLLDLILTCKRNAEIEVRREEGEGMKAPERKRKLEQETAERALKYFKASQETGRPDRIPAGGNKVPSSPFSFTSVIGSLGLKDVDLRDDGSELTDKFIMQLKGLIKTANQSFCEAQDEGLKEFSPFGRLATKLGLPTNCDIDLRKQEELEELTAGSVSSLEGFSPGSHSGDTNHHGAPGRGGRLGRKGAANEAEEKEWEIPWVLIPITGLCSGRYSQRNRNIPQDPRFQHFTTATSITTTRPSRRSPTSSPEPSLPPSTTQLPSPDPSPPPSPSQCPSPDPSPPGSPSQCPSPDPSPPVSPSQCPSPDPSPPNSPAEPPSPEPSPPLIPTQCRSLEPTQPNPFNKNHSGANEPWLPPTVPKELHGVSDEKEMKPPGNEIKKEEPSVSARLDRFGAPAPEPRNTPSPPPTDQVMESEGEAEEGEEEIQPSEEEQKQTEEEADLCKHVKREEGMMLAEGANEQEKEAEVKGGATFPPSVSSNTTCPPRDIDSIVDKHLGDFASDIQLLLQEESGNCIFPQLLRSSSNAEAAALQHALPYASLSPFSHYVSFYNPCPPVQDYVSSLKDDISCMLGEIDVSWPKRQADTSRTDVDETLAQRISDFVASFRAASTETGRKEQTAADVDPPVSQSSVFTRVGDIWQSEDAHWTPPSPHLPVSDPPSAFGSTYSPEGASENSRTLAQNNPEAQDNGVSRTVVCTTDEESEGSLAGANCIVTVPGYSTGSDTQTDPSQPYEPVSSLSAAFAQETGSEPVPSPKRLSSVINQLNPDVLNNLVEIAKDIKRKSPQFYVHCAVPGDPVYEEVKEHLLKLGNVQQSPVDFLHNENSENGLLVIIKNKDAAGHIHKIPGLMSLKRHPSVVFVGIDSLDDIKNNSCIELFVSGGCVVSDELLLSPDSISHDRLAALLMLLEQHSSPESVWRWKIHCKTHKKLKEQARFRKDAANLLDVLSTYQKRQIVEFLPYHHCDMTNHQSPDLDCLIELQARYTQFRHTIYLTEHHFEKFPAFSGGGVMVAGVEELLQNFTGLVGCHDVRDKQLLVEDLLAPKGLSGQANPQELSPSTFPENVHPISSSSRPQELLPQPPSSAPHPSDQIVPDSFSKDSMSPTTSRDMEFLQQAIRQLRAQRLQQLQQLKQQQQQLEVQLESSIGPLPQPAGTATPPLVHEGPAEQVQVATLGSVHSVLQPGPWEERLQLPTEGRGRRGSPEGDDPGGQRRCPQVRAEGLQTGNWTSTAAAVTEPISDGSEGEPGQRGEPKSPPAAERDALRDTQSDREQPGTLQSSSAAAGSKVTRIPVVPERNGDPNPRHALSEQPSPAPMLPLSQLPRGVGLLHPPHVAPFHGQPFHPGALLGPLHPLRGIRTFMGPTHLWPGGLPPTGAPLVWGYQQTGTDFLGGYHGPAGPGGHMYRGARPGGGFNGM
ncbi:protein TASOR [Kryptolebias marmoratus]|uniref:Transcription activation suppressor n=1 Tax=Kryptolebias marmoratus TaxID=37003 RepID=A0A3Q3GMG3_KRYMA|nr:protein TASOR [Kryptolebias marmoratus]